MKRGDVIVVRMPHPSGARGKKRPAVIVQADVYASKIRTVIAAEITKNLSMADDPACLFLDSKTSDGLNAGLAVDSVATALFLSTVYANEVETIIGTLSPALMAKFDDCLKAALALS